MNEHKKAAIQKMKDEKLPESVINNFIRLLEQVEKGSTGFIREQEIKPLTTVEKYSELKEFEDLGVKNLNKLVFIKLNGGLGTSMGLDKAKSLIEVKPGLSFLDITANQLKIIQKKHEIKTPLMLMNSFSTHEDTKSHLKKHEELEIFSFTQFKHPKIYSDNMMPANEKENNLNWNPPGHGDIYLALLENKLLDELEKKGYEYIFISNSDNLGASIDTKILGYLISKNMDFLMEVAERTAMDKKGGHLAFHNEKNKIILRESAQCHIDDKEHFEDTKKHKYFNTNNIWVKIKSLKKVLKENKGIIPLPLIRNEKTVDPKNPETKKVIQIETAMGAAIELFNNSSAIMVPRERFLPVKKTNELLLLLSDLFELNENYQLEFRGKKIPEIILDEKFYKFINHFKERIIKTPSLIECESLIIKGDFKFLENVKFVGKVILTNETKNQITLKNITISGEKLFS